MAFVYHWPLSSTRVICNIALARMVFMNTQFTRVCLAFSVACLWTTTVSAQFGTGSSGTGTSGTGSTSSGTGSTGSSGSGLQGLTASTSGLTTGATGTSTGSNSSSQSTGSTASRTTGNTATTGNAAQTFVGGNATDAFVGGARQSTNQQGMNRQFAQFQASQALTNTLSQQTGTPRSIRTVMNIGFKFPTASLSQQSGRLAAANSLDLSRFSTSHPELAGVSVEMNSLGIAVLKGSLPTTEAGRLAANLIRIQPGVRKVENQIAVSQ